MLNESEYGQIDVDGELRPIPDEVRMQFRRVRAISEMLKYPRISVFDRKFGSADRAEYFQLAKRFIDSFRDERAVVFLDPDTGLRPRDAGDEKHVFDEEARELWDAIPEGWAYGLYQHQTNRAGEPWIHQKREEFAKAIGVNPGDVYLASAEKIARDVAFYYATKGDARLRDSD